MSLEIIELSKSYLDSGKEVQVLDNCSFSLKQGTVNALVGASGCGKTTLLMIAGGLLKPSGGSVMINGRDATQMSSNELDEVKAKEIGYLFQAFHLVPYLNVEENILLAGINSQRGNNRERMLELAELFGLTHRLDHIPSKLSQGEQQRVALSRALFNDPKILIADEPTGNLDDENSQLVTNAFREFSDNGGVVLLATHSKEVASCADTVYKSVGNRFVLG